MVLHNVKAPIQMAARATAVAMLCAALSIGQSIAAQARDQKAGEIKERRDVLLLRYAWKVGFSVNPPSPESHGPGKLLKTTFSGTWLS
jgi:hypothetical protein